MVFYDMKITSKQLYWYAKYLLLVYAFTIIISSGFIVYTDGATCYRELTQEEILFEDSIGSYMIPTYSVEDDCTIVKDITTVKQDINRYMVISIFCIIGYLIFQPRSKYKKIMVI